MVTAADGGAAAAARSDASSSENEGDHIGDAFCPECYGLVSTAVGASAWGVCSVTRRQAVCCRDASTDRPWPPLLALPRRAGPSWSSGTCPASAASSCERSSARTAATGEPGRRAACVRACVCVQNGGVGGGGARLLRCRSLPLTAAPRAPACRKEEVQLAGQYGEQGLRLSLKVPLGDAATLGRAVLKSDTATGEPC